MIEDDIDIRETLEEFLVLKEFEVSTATNGIEGIALAKEILPDVVICDIQIPEIDGFEVLDYIKNTLPKEILFVFITSFSEKKDKENGIRQLVQVAAVGVAVFQ